MGSLFLFGQCRSGVSSPIGAVNPGATPKVIDTIPPSGVSRATEPDPTQGPVTVHGIPAP